MTDFWRAALLTVILVGVPLAALLGYALCWVSGRVDRAQDEWEEQHSPAEE